MSLTIFGYGIIISSCELSLFEDDDDEEGEEDIKILIKFIRENIINTHIKIFYDKNNDSNDVFICVGKYYSQSKNARCGGYNMINTSVFIPENLKKIQDITNDIKNLIESKIETKIESEPGFYLYAYES
jgi:hypothetical protein